MKGINKIEYAQLEAYRTQMAPIVSELMRLFHIIYSKEFMGNNEIQNMNASLIASIDIENIESMEVYGRNKSELDRRQKQSLAKLVRDAILTYKTLQEKNNDSVFYFNKNTPKGVRTISPKYAIDKKRWSSKTLKTFKFLQNNKAIIGTNYFSPAKIKNKKVRETLLSLRKNNNTAYKYFAQAYKMGDIIKNKQLLQRGNTINTKYKDEGEEYKDISGTTGTTIFYLYEMFSNQKSMDAKLKISKQLETLITSKKGALTYILASYSIIKRFQQTSYIKSKLFNKEFNEWIEVDGINPKADKFLIIFNSVSQYITELGVELTEEFKKETIIEFNLKEITEILNNFKKVDNIINEIKKASLN